MINSVSSVSFKAAPQVSAQERLNAPGKFTTEPKTAATGPKEKGGFLKGLAKFAAAVIVAGGAVFAVYKKGGVQILDEAAQEGAKWYQKAGHYLAKAGEFIDTKIWQKLPVVGKKAEKAA